jgi:hypothetical protein
VRYCIIIGILCVFAPAAFAQAADKDAIDLSGKMDTIALGSADGNIGLSGFLNVSLQNPDNWEDFEILKVSTSGFSLMRFGGPLIFDTTNNPVIYDDPVLYGDFDGDGVGDIIADNGGLFFKGKSAFPYFNPGSTSQFVSHYKFESFFNPKVIDFDGDGISDYLVCTGDHNVRLYKGGSSFGTTKYMFATDSIQFPGSPLVMTVDRFGLHLKPTVLCICNNTICLLKHIGNTFAQDSIILVSDSTELRATNLYAMDITGDGITDLIVSDNYHIYIFKGGDDFGTYQFGPKNAFYTIKSPRLTDFGNFGFVDDFGEFSIRNCGDLTGSGIPYLAVGGDQSGSGFNKGYQFFYAGGKALDTLYDAIAGYVGLGLGRIDTLHNIDNTGKTVCLLNDFEDFNFNNRDIDFLMSRDCDKIPHKTNPHMLDVKPKVSQSSACILQAQLGGGFVKIIINGESLGANTLHIFNMLGQEVAARDIGSIEGKSIEMFSTSDLADGTYLAELRGAHAHAIVKFPVNRLMKEMAPESPVILQMNETIPSVLR